jgi:ABC-type multidrug transport system fused ATPase/permease subunit
LIRILEAPSKGEISETKFVSEHPNFSPSIFVKNLTMKYENAESPAIAEVDFSVDPGCSLAIVGPSGAGKTTLVDLILGVSEPDFGKIEISGQAPLAAIRANPGSIAYVPQDIVVTNGTIRENIVLGFNVDQISDSQIWAALKLAHLDDFIRNLPGELESLVGERGNRLSGGQRQRLGIARALITNPKLLVLDEATSALDSQTESALSESLEFLHGKVTVVLVAHRLSSIRVADKIIYLDGGKVIAQGDFNELRKLVPDFDLQANLIGL